MAVQLNAGTGGVPASADLLNATTGLNGGAPDIANEQVQRVKLGFGPDSFLRDVDAANPLPVTNPSSLPLPIGAAQDGTDITAPTAMPAGGVGIRGWLSAIWTKLNGALFVSDSVVTGTASLTAAAQALTLTLGGSKANTAFQISGTWVGTITFEASNDGFTTTPTTIFALKAGDNTTSTSISNSVSNDIYRCSTAGFTAVRAVMSAFTSGTATVTGNATANTSGVFLNFPLPPGNNTIGTVNVSSAAMPATYSSAVNGLALAATATDVFTISGSATKTIRVTKLAVNGIQTTAGQVGVVLLRRSTANAGGTATASVMVPYDSINAAGSAVVSAYTANPATPGTLVGSIYSQRVFFPGAATASDAQGLDILFGDVGQQPMTLRGTAQILAVNLAGVSVVGGSANISIEWTES